MCTFQLLSVRILCMRVRIGAVSVDRIRNYPRRYIEEILFSKKKDFSSLIEFNNAFHDSLTRDQVSFSDQRPIEGRGISDPT